MKKFLVAAAAVLLFGCATIVRNDEQLVNIQSNVEWAKIEIMKSNGEVVWSGYAPSTVLLNAADYGMFNPQKYTIRATKEGYGTAFAEIDWHVSMWYVFGNLFSWGIFGWLIVDPISGDMFYLDDTAYLNLGYDPAAHRELEASKSLEKSYGPENREVERPTTNEGWSSEWEFLLEFRALLDCGSGKRFRRFGFQTPPIIFIYAFPARAVSSVPERLKFLNRQNSG